MTEQPIPEAAKNYLAEMRQRHDQEWQHGLSLILMGMDLTGVVKVDTERWVVTTPDHEQDGQGGS